VLARKVFEILERVSSQGEKNGQEARWRIKTTKHISIKHLSTLVNDLFCFCLISPLWRVHRRERAEALLCWALRMVC
jgi:hypothetical protein